MSATTPLNDSGRKYWTRKGTLRRASTAELSFNGVPLHIEYHASGFDSDAYVEQIRAIEIGGVECLAIFSEEQVGDLCERIQQSWDVQS
jgi:hypothetical protein